jgi:hypothetical protein
MTSMPIPLNATSRGNPADGDISLDEYARLTPTQQAETQSRFNANIEEMLEKIKSKFAGTRHEGTLENLQFHKLEWCDPHRTPGSYFGLASTDLKQMWRLVKRGADGEIVTETAWLPGWTIALGSNFLDPRTKLDAASFWTFTTNRNGNDGCSRKLSEVLADPRLYFDFQGVAEGASLSDHAELMVANRSSLIWTPTEEDAANGWEVQTCFEHFTYQDQNPLRGPQCYSLYGSPMGLSFYTGCPGHQSLFAKLEDKVTGKLMNYPTKPEATDREIDSHGKVEVQTDESKVADLGKGKAVQVKMGVAGMPSQSGMEFCAFGMMERAPEGIDWKMGAIDFFSEKVEPDGVCFRSLSAMQEVEPDEVCYRSLSATQEVEPDGACYRSLRATPEVPAEFETGQVTEAALSLGAAVSEAAPLSVKKPKSTNHNIALTQYKRWALVFGTVPEMETMEAIVTNLLSNEETTRGAKTAEHVPHRHSESAKKTFKDMTAQPDYDEITESIEKYAASDVVPDGVLPTEDPDSEDEDASKEPPSKAMKTE